MKLIHLSDLHLGKRVNEFSMIGDQEYILKEILSIIDREKPDGVMIAGDVYDKSVPSAEAVTLLDDFLVSLARRGVEVFLVSGNHDSPERLAFGNRLMDASGIHIASAFDGRVQKATLKGESGDVCVHMLPFVKPANVRRFFPEEEIASYTDAVRVALAGAGEEAAGPAAKEAKEAAGTVGSDGDGAAGDAAWNILICHQFVTGALRSESEEISVGGVDNVDASVFGGFDYVALGHIHGPQDIEKDRIRYCGTPLKYSFSEAGHEKSVTVVELGEKSGIGITVRTVPLVPMHDMKEIKGRYEEVTLRSFYEPASGEEGFKNDYLHITLTDEEDIPDVVRRLRVIYPNLMKVDYDNTRTRSSREIGGAEAVEQKTPGELFAEFYEAQNGQEMTEEQTELVRGLIESIRDGEIK